MTATAGTQIIYLVHFGYSPAADAPSLLPTSNHPQNRMPRLIHGK